MIPNMTTGQTDDQDITHSNSTNRRSGYNTLQQYKWSVSTVVMLCILIVCLCCCKVLYPDRFFVLLLCFISWWSVYIVMCCILIDCAYCCYVLYLDRLFVLLLCFACWSSVCTVVMLFTEVQTDDQDTKHSNCTNRQSRYKT
jgi:hypothetical protein